MRNLFAVPWLTLSYRTVVTILAAVISVFSIFGLLKINSRIKTPAKEMLTGSIQRSHGVLKPASSDPMAAFHRSRFDSLKPTAGAKHDDG